MFKNNINIGKTLGKLFSNSFSTNNRLNQNFRSTIPINMLQNLTFKNIQIYFEQQNIKTINPFLHFSFDSDHVEKLMILMKNDFVKYYQNQIKMQNPVHFYVKNQLLSFIKGIIENGLLEYFLPCDKFTSETIFVIFKRFFPKILTKFNLKNSNSRESKKNRFNFGNFWEKDFSNFKSILKNHSNTVLNKFSIINYKFF